MDTKEAVVANFKTLETEDNDGPLPDTDTKSQIPEQKAGAPETGKFSPPFKLRKTPHV
jgi:hypothetical protein